MPARSERGDAMAAMYEKGASLTEVGRHFGVSCQAVHRALLARDIPRRPCQGGRPRTEAGDQMAAMYQRDERVTIQQVADHFGVVPNTVWQALAIRGIPRRPVGPRKARPEQVRAG